MRKLNSTFLTHIISELDKDTCGRIYYGYVELDNCYCLAIAESFDGDKEAESAKAAVCTAISYFTEKPGMKKSVLKKCLFRTHQHMKSQSVKTNLKVSLLLLVSDYNKVRLAGSGNAQAFVFRENRIVFKSRTQTLYQRLLDQGKLPNDGETGKEELYNMLSFLGMRWYFRPEISKKIALQDGDWILLSSCAIHHKLSDPELLEAYEGKSETAEFLRDLEELYLTGRTERNYSYVLAAVESKKVYREEEKKRKRIKFIVIIAIVLLLAILLITGIVCYSRKKQEEVQLKIDQYQRYADSSIAAQDYKNAEMQYEKALEEAGKIRKNSLRMETEEELLQRQSLLFDLDQADSAYKTGNSEQARSLYEGLLVKGKQFPSMQLDKFISKRYKECGQAAEAEYLLEYAGMLEEIGQYKQAVSTLNQAGNLMTILGDVEGSRDVRLSVFRINQLMEEEYDAAEEQDKGSEVSKIQARETEAQQAVMEGDYETALSIYKEMRTELIAMGAEEEAGKIYTMIVSLKEQMRDQGISAKTVQEEIELKKQQAQQATSEQDIIKAVELYWELSYLYLGIGDKKAADDVYMLIWELESGAESSEGSG